MLFTGLLLMAYLLSLLSYAPQDHLPRLRPCGLGFCLSIINQDNILKACLQGTYSQLRFLLSDDSSLHQGDKDEPPQLRILIVVASSLGQERSQVWESRAG